MIDFDDAPMPDDADAPDAPTNVVPIRARQRAGGVFAGEWGEPEKLDTFDAPPLPADCLPDWIAALVQSIAAALEVPPESVLTYVLGVLSAAVCGRLDVRCGPHWCEPVNLYLATVLPSGERKSATTKIVSAPLVEAEKSLCTGARAGVERARTQRTIKEARAKACERIAAEDKEPSKRDAAARDAEQLRAELAESDIPTMPRISADDVTPEQLVTLLCEQEGRLAVISAEASILDSISRYTPKGAPPSIDVLLRAHAGDSVRVDRRGRSEYIDSPRLTIAVALQPSHLARWGQSADVEGRGLLARFGIFLPEPMLGFRPVKEPEVDREAYGRFTVVVQRLVEAFRPLETPHQVVLCSEASEEFLAWRKQQEPRRRPSRDLGHLTAFSSKSEGLVARLSAVFAAAEAAEASPEVLGVLGSVSLDQIQRAIRLTDTFVQHASGVRRRIQAGEVGGDLRAVAAWVLEHPQGFTTRDAQQNFKARLGDVKVVRDLLSDLGRRHWIRRATPDAGSGKGGRPSERWEVNPATKGFNPNTPNTSPDGGS